MPRALLVVVLMLAALAAGACKGRKKQPAPAAAAADAGTGDASAAPRIPSATEPDVNYEARRDELLRRGDPERMKPAPVIDQNAPATDPAEMIKVVSRDVMMVGASRVDLAAGTLEIPVENAAPLGPIEYVLVARGGKAYESLFVADVSVVEVRLALTLLGYEGTIPTDDGKVAPPTAADTVLASVRIGDQERPLSHFLIDRRTGKAPADAPWQVLGFRTIDRAGAVHAKELMAVISRDVLVPLRATVDAGNPYAQGQGLQSRAGSLPAAGTKVTLVLRRRPDAPRPAPAGGSPSPAAPARTP